MYRNNEVIRKNVINNLVKARKTSNRLLSIKKFNLRKSSSSRRRRSRVRKLVKALANRKFS